MPVRAAAQRLGVPFLILLSALLIVLGKADILVVDRARMAVADVIEAMSSHRPYRPGAGIEKALAEIEQGRGATYDAKVADACLRLFRDKGYAIAD